MVDPRTGGLNDDAVGGLVAERPWGTWVETHRTVRPPEPPGADALTSDDLLARQVAHGYTREDLSLVLRPSAANAHEPTFSMGDDTPIAALSRHGRSVFNHLRQRFAQVTNPAMDHLRERSVMSLQVLLGPRAPLLSDRPDAAALEELESFFLWARPSGRRLNATWRVGGGAGGMRRAIQRLAAEALAAVRDGEDTLVVTDIAVGHDRAPIPTVLATGAVNAALTRASLRTRCSLIVEADDVRESHHVACLLAVGAQAIRPRLASATVAAGASDADAAMAALARYREAIEDGVRKTLAKLGISCAESYRGAEAIDVLGLDDEVASTCFVSTRSSLAGLGFDDLASAILERHASAYGSEPGVLANPGYVNSVAGANITPPSPLSCARLTVLPTRRSSGSAPRRPERGRAPAPPTMSTSGPPTRSPGRSANPTGPNSTRGTRRSCTTDLRRRSATSWSSFRRHRPFRSTRWNPRPGS